MIVLGSADTSNRNGWRPLPEFFDTVTADGAFVSLDGETGSSLKDWPLGDAAALDLDALDE